MASPIYSWEVGTNLEDENEYTLARNGIQLWLASVENPGVRLVEKLGVSRNGDKPGIYVSYPELNDEDEISNFKNSDFTIGELHILYRIFRKRNGTFLLHFKRPLLNGAVKIHHANGTTSSCLQFDENELDTLFETTADRPKDKILEHVADIARDMDQVTETFRKFIKHVDDGEYDEARNELWETLNTLDDMVDPEEVIVKTPNQCRFETKSGRVVFHGPANAQCKRVEDYHSVANELGILSNGNLKGHFYGIQRIISDHFNNYAIYTDSCIPFNFLARKHDYKAHAMELVNAIQILSTFFIRKNQPLPAKDDVDGKAVDLKLIVHGNIRPSNIYYDTTTSKLRLGGLETMTFINYTFYPSKSGKADELCLVYDNASIPVVEAHDFIRAEIPTLVQGRTSDKNSMRFLNTDLYSLGYALLSMEHGVEMSRMTVDQLVQHTREGQKGPNVELPMICFDSAERTRWSVYHACKALRAKLRE